MFKIIIKHYPIRIWRLNETKENVIAQIEFLKIFLKKTSRISTNPKNFKVNEKS